MMAAIPNRGPRPMRVARTQMARKVSDTYFCTWSEPDAARWGRSSAAGGEVADAPWGD